MPAGADRAAARLTHIIDVFVSEGNTEGSIKSRLIERGVSWHSLRVLAMFLFLSGKSDPTFDTIRKKENWLLAPLVLSEKLGWRMSEHRNGIIRLSACAGCMKTFPVPGRILMPDAPVLDTRMDDLHGVASIG